MSLLISKRTRLASCRQLDTSDREVSSKSFMCASLLIGVSKKQLQLFPESHSDVEIRVPIVLSFFTMNSCTCMGINILIFQCIETRRFDFFKLPYKLTKKIPDSVEHKVITTAGDNACGDKRVYRTPRKRRILLQVEKL